MLMFLLLTAQMITYAEHNFSCVSGGRSTILREKLGTLYVRYLIKIIQAPKFQNNRNSSW